MAWDKMPLKNKEGGGGGGGGAEKAFSPFFMSAEQTVKLVR